MYFGCYCQKLFKKNFVIQNVYIHYVHLDIFKISKLFLKLFIIFKLIYFNCFLKH